MINDVKFVFIRFGLFFFYSAFSMRDLSEGTGKIFTWREFSGVPWVKKTVRIYGITFSFELLYQLLEEISFYGCSHLFISLTRLFLSRGMTERILVQSNAHVATAWT